MIQEELTNFLNNEYNNKKVFQEVIKKLIDQTKGDSNVKIVDAVDKLKYSIKTELLIRKGDILLQDVMDYINELGINPEEYENVIIDFIKNDIKDKIWN